jgi:hypothetical protein
MSPDNTSKSDAEQTQAKKPESIKDLNDAKVSGKDADQVKGGFNPQPDTPGRSKKTF